MPRFFYACTAMLFIVPLAATANDACSNFSCYGRCNNFFFRGWALPSPGPPPTRGRSLVAPQKGLRARYSAVKGKYNFRICSSREKALNNFDISPVLQVLVAAAQTYSNSVKWAKAEAAKRLSRGINYPISSPKLLPRNLWPAEPFRGIHKGLSPCVGRLGGAKPRQDNSTLMDRCSRTSHCQNLSRKKKLNNKSRLKERAVPSPLVG